MPGWLFPIGKSFFTRTTKIGRLIKFELPEGLGKAHKRD